MEKRLRRPPRLRGTITPPGDKSISHRAIIFNAIAEGRALVENFLPGEDCLATLRCLQTLGAEISYSASDAPSVVVKGAGRCGLRESADILDCGNSGTTMRLLTGLLAGQPFFSVLTGDASIRQRPMGRIVQPLRQMGAQVWGRDGGERPPLAIVGAGLRGIAYKLPVASAQVKSALILAALFAAGETYLREPSPSRDHSERLLRAMGATIEAVDGGLEVQPLVNELRACDVRIPGDISAAAYWMVAACLHPDAEVCLVDVGTNPTRRGIIDVLKAMGADLSVVEKGEQAGEPVADIVVRSSRLRSTLIEGELIPRVIDELPVLALAAALAEGDTLIRDAAELRVKESDRISTTVSALSRLGARIEERPDGMVVHGGATLKGALCHSHGDHRLAMTLGAAAMVAQGETVVSGAESVAVSYPGFWHDWGTLAGREQT